MVSREAGARDLSAVSEEELEGPLKATRKH